MTLEGVFRLVAAGRMEAVGRYGWTCPLCDRELGFSEDSDSRDREAMRHCLAHSYRRMGRLPQIELNSVRRDKSRAFLPDGRAVSCQPGLRELLEDEPRSVSWDGLSGFPRWLGNLRTVPSSP